MVSPNPYSAVRDVLACGDFDRFKGMREGLHFEAKGKAAYDLNTPGGRYELAKDASAFANAEGGHIVIGLLTRRVPDQKTDEVEECDLVGNGEPLRVQILGVLKEYVYPRIKDLQVDWVASRDMPGAGVISVFVPRQEEERKFFLITKNVHDGQEVKIIVVGIACRVGADSVPLTPDELHRLIREGHSPVSQRLTRIEEKIDGLLGLERQPPGRTAEEQMNARIEALLNRE